MPVAPATPDTTELGRGCRTLEPAAGPETPEESLPPVADDSLPEPEAAPPCRPDPAAAPPGARTGPRTVGDLVAGAEDEAEVEESDDPDEPADPVVSANATGTDATAEPTPRATASAPTLPT